MNQISSFFGILIFLSIFTSCNQTKSLVETPSFLAENSNPSKPSFEDNEIYDEYFQEGYDTLAALDTSNTLPPSSKPWLTNTNFYVDISYGYSSPNCFSMGYNYGNYFGYSPYSYYGYSPYGYDPFGNFNYGINNQYGNCMVPSYWYDDYYYSMYAQGYYWGSMPYSCGAGSQVNYYPHVYNPPAPQRIYSSNGNMEPTPISRPNPVRNNSPVRSTPTKSNTKNSYARPTPTKNNSYARATPKRIPKATTSNLITKSSYDHKTKQRTNTRSGYYNRPTVKTPTTSTQTRSSSQGNTNRPTQNSSSNSSSYGSSSSSPSRATPTRATPTRSTPSRATPTRSAPTRTAPSRATPTRTAPSRSSSSSRSTPAPSRSSSSQQSRTPSRTAPSRPNPR